MPQNIGHNAPSIVDYQAGAGALLLCDSAPATERARQAAELAGFRVKGSELLITALARLDRQAAVDLVIIDVEQDQGELLDQLLARIDRDTRDDLYRGIVNAPENLIDLIDARTGAAAKVIHLCNPTEAERVDAALLARRCSPIRLHDGQRYSERLQQLSEEVGHIARAIAELPADKATGANHLDANKVRAMIRERRLRDKYFRAELFADPSWDMLLDLMAARLEGQRVTVSSLCIAAAVPATTALRWIAALTDEGLLVRVADPEDRRRAYIDLTDAAASALENYLRAARGLSPPAT